MAEYIDIEQAKTICQQSQTARTAAMYSRIHAAGADHFMP